MEQIVNALIQSNANNKIEQKLWLSDCRQQQKAIFKNCFQISECRKFDFFCVAFFRSFSLSSPHLTTTFYQQRRLFLSPKGIMLEKRVDFIDSDLVFILHRFWFVRSVWLCLFLEQREDCVFCTKRGLCNVWDVGRTDWRVLKIRRFFLKKWGTVK